MNDRILLPCLAIALSLVAISLSLGCARAGVRAAASQPAGKPVNMETSFCVAELEDGLHPYRIFFPSNYVHAPKAGETAPLFPLVIACHPAGGDETQYFEWKASADRIQTIAEERGYVVACPAAPMRNWHEMKGEGDNQQISCKEKSPEVIMEVIREIVKQRHIDENRIYLTGASSGGMATYGTAAKHPERFAAVAGVVALFNDSQVEGLSKVPVLMFNGVKEQNKVFAIDKVRAMRDKLAKAGGEVKLHEVPGGHGGYRNMKSYAVIFDWFDAHRRTDHEQKPVTGNPES